MKSLKYSLLLVLSVFVLNGCKTIEENIQWAKENKEGIKDAIALIKDIPFSEQEAVSSGLAVETIPEDYRSWKTTKVANPPQIEVAATITGNDLSLSIADLFPGVYVDALADDKYAILTLDSIKDLIAWSQVVRSQIGFQWRSNVSDCDNFSRLFREGVKYALAQSHPEIDAEAICANFWVINKTPWAGVRDGMHALNMMPYYDQEKDRYGILVIEPQNGIYTDLSMYPNIKNVYKITVSGG